MISGKKTWLILITLHAIMEFTVEAKVKFIYEPGNFLGRNYFPFGFDRF